MTLTMVPDFSGFSTGLIHGLGNREVAVGNASRYLPLVLPVGQDYHETLNLLDGVGDRTAQAQATVRVGAPQHYRQLTVPVTYGDGDTLELVFQSSDVAQLFAVAEQDNAPVGDWALAIKHDVPTDYEGIHLTPKATVLATGPVTFILPRRRKQQSWLDVSPGTDLTERTGWLRGEEKGAYQDGVAYEKGAVVTMGGKVFMALCNTDGTPGSGPNLDTSDPDTNTILTDVFPGPPTVVAADDTADGETATPATATATATSGGTT